MKKLTIDGMHCNACISLITMELEEAGLDSMIGSIELSSDNKGMVLFNDSISDEQLAKATELINSMDNYQVV